VGDDELLLLSSFFGVRTDFTLLPFLSTLPFPTPFGVVESIDGRMEVSEISKRSDRLASKGQSVNIDLSTDRICSWSSFLPTPPIFSIQRYFRNSVDRSLSNRFSRSSDHCQHLHQPRKNSWKSPWHSSSSTGQSLSLFMDSLMICFQMMDLSSWSSSCWLLAALVIFTLMVLTSKFVFEILDGDHLCDRTWSICRV
jgi:hypothetical protein